MVTNRWLRILDHNNRTLLPWAIRVGKRGLLLAALLSCLLPQSLLAAVTSNSTDGVLTVTSDADDPIEVTCGAALQVLVNGENPDSGVADCGTTTAIEVFGGPGDNTIDLTDVESTEFSILTEVTVDGGGANDLIAGSSLGDTLKGGDGDDTLVGNGGDDVLNGDDGNDLIRGGRWRRYSRRRRGQ